MPYLFLYLNWKGGYSRKRKRLGINQSPLASCCPLFLATAAASYDRSSSSSSSSSSIRIAIPRHSEKSAQVPA